jgi:Class II histone deacetylase complex subunits 2 and 3
MDLSFNPEDDQVLRLRQHPTNLEELSPLIRLVTINSAEHVRLCLPSPYEIPSDRERLPALVAATTVLRNFNGVEVSTDESRYESVAEYIRSGGKRGGDVFGIRDIEGYMVGHKGLAGLAISHARPDADENDPPRKRLRKEVAIWQVRPPRTTPINSSNPRYSNSKTKTTN